MAKIQLSLLTPKISWNDLRLDEKTLEQLKQIKNWLQHPSSAEPDWSYNKKLRPGFRCLFHGPAGAGKTTTAALIGNELNRDVYRIDLSLLVSKYIGETEKNISKIFDEAGHKNWILFFDEADALFGKRTGIQDAHDRYANKETSYLLQRMEEHQGLVILATNKKSNIDDAFIRRLNLVVSFILEKLPGDTKKSQ